MWSERWVLLVDLLGFSEGLKRPGGEERIAKVYSDITKFIRDGPPVAHIVKPIAATVLERAPEAAPDIEALTAALEELRRCWAQSVRIFSDSIFVFFDPGMGAPLTLPNALLLEWTAGVFSALLWERALPHRGALAYGRCYVDHDASVFLGLPIVRAAEWERVQQWMGISIEPTSVDRVPPKFIGFNEFNVLTKSGRVPSRCVRPAGIPERVMAKDILGGFLTAYEDARTRGLVSVLPLYVETARVFASTRYDTPEIRRIGGLPPRGERGVAFS